MAYTLNRRLSQLVDSNGQLNNGKIPNDYISSDHIADNVITSAMLHTSFTVSTSNLTSIDTDDVSEGTTNLYFTNARVDTEIDSYLSGGTGVTYSSGAISIGQDVSTTATPTFGNITTTGYIAGPATFTIDPAAVGDNTGTVVIAGNLQVDGTTTTINSTTMTVDDLNITLASGAANAAAANGAGITVDGASATITYDGTNDEWDFNKNVNINGTISSGRIIISSDAGNEQFYIQRASNTNEQLILGFHSSDYATIQAVEQGVDWRPLALNPNGGKVGIGTNTPDSILHIKNTSADAKITLETSEDYDCWINFSGATSEASIGYEPTNNLLVLANASDGVSNSSTQRLVIDSSGKVGIGTNTPDNILHIFGEEDTINLKIEASLTTVSGTDYQNYQEIKFVGGSSDQNPAGIRHHANVWSTNNSALSFWTNTHGGSYSERMRIDGDGNVGIGTTSIVNNAKLNIVGGGINVDSGIVGANVSDAFTFRGRTQPHYGANFSPTGSTNNHIAISGYYGMSFATSGLERLTILGNGKVGIGQDTPAESLHIGSGQSNFIRIHNAASGDITSGITITRGNSDGAKLYDNPADDATTLLTAGSLNFRVNNANRAMIDTSGRVIIHDDVTYTANAPTHRGSLILAGASGFTNYGGIEFHTSSGGGAGYGTRIVSSDATLFFGRRFNAVGWTESLRIDNNGHIGLGTAANPDRQLHVKGSGTTGGRLKLENTDTSAYAGIVMNANPREYHIGVGGSSTSSGFASSLYFYDGTAGANRFFLDSNGHLLPATDNSYDLGSTSYRWRNIYTTDLHLSNEGKPEGNQVDGTTGNWTIQEGEDHLYIINNRNGKKYKFALEEIE